MEYFSFQWIFVFCGVCKVFIYLIYIPTNRYSITFGELIHTQYENEPQRFKNDYFGPFSLLDAC